MAICQHEDLVVDRLELLYEAPRKQLADQLTADIAQVSPETRVVHRHFPLSDPWDFETVFARLHDFARDYEFDTEREDYLVHMRHHLGQLEDPDR